MQRFLLFVFIFLFNFLQSQIFTCNDGLTKFTSEAPLELIKAQSHKTKGVIDCKAKNVAFSIEVETFDGFNSGLQKEHFKENYMETTKFPTAVFKGKIIEDIDFTQKGTSNVRAKGIFTIHGVSKEKIVKVKIVIKENLIEIDTTFDIPIEDHNIKVPKIVNQKIASIISVETKASLKPKS